MRTENHFPWKMSIKVELRKDGRNTVDWIEDICFLLNAVKGGKYAILGMKIVL